MSTVHATPKTRKPVSRSVTILEQPTHDSDGWGALEITVGKETATYLCRFIPCELGAGILGLELEKLTPELAVEERYHVAVDPLHQEHSCECLGHLRHGHCKHVDGLAKLVELGRLTPPAKTAFRSAGDMAANSPDAWDEHLADVA